ncbi:MAG: type I-B CRISPR-associated protein Cas7/Cst2/DevR [Methanobacteriaceae archaeon]|jgi:CRISPR-associated protein Cst2|nr:type I-B CRISPR-associated protein Cas7/Cst2/DevR [Methanobacteriaceae archaeon]
MGKYIVMDIVFYGNSLNYDQGSGNYQELKKLTKWDGQQYSLVSRYALRFSLLETAKNIGLWNLAEGSNLTTAGSGDKKVIQPAAEFLLSGEILGYPEFDLFGYLITDTQPQNFRTAPVKINHAVSMTPFNYDALFNANIGLANRMRKQFGDMKPNPFTAEEHETFYQYTIVINADNVGSIESYLAKKIKDGGKDKTMSNVQLKQNETNLINFEISYGTGNTKKTIDFTHNNEKEPKTTISKMVLPFKEEDDKVKIEGLQNPEIIEYNENLGAMIIQYQIDEKAKKKRIEDLLKSILNLKRSIKGREEDLAPKLMVMGVYKNKPYKTYKDKIVLLDEYVEEEYDEIEETPMENGGRLVKVRHKTTKSRKPLFEIPDIRETESLDENKILQFIEPLFNGENQSEEYEAIKIFKDTSIKVKNDNE